MPSIAIVFLPPSYQNDVEKIHTPYGITFMWGAAYRFMSYFEEFHRKSRKYILGPADKATNNVVVVWRLHYINTLKQELSGTKAYEQTSIKRSLSSITIFFIMPLGLL